MEDSTWGFAVCVVAFSIELALSYFITAACIDGVFPRRDILFFPLVMLTIAGVLSYLVNSFAVFEPMFEHLRTVVSLYSTCLGGLIGLCAASLVRRAKLIKLAAESREATA
ncbi:MAG: hypothetical protein JNN01_00290 [Opitutaceae bacterium]|nr:hypothetical protein [Opitutaceae bacterium]